MERTIMQTIILPSKDKKVKKSNAALVRHAQAHSMVDLIFAIPPGTPKRWRAIQRLYLSLSWQYRQAHVDAVRETKQARVTLLDPIHGKSRNTLAGGKDLKTGKHTQNLRMLGIMPEGLKDMLRRFDPLHLGIPTGRDAILQWRKVYKEF